MIHLTKPQKLWIVLSLAFIVIFPVTLFFLKPSPRLPLPATPTSVEPTTTAQQYQDEMQEEVKHAKDDQQIQQSYPWIDQLPLITDTYFVYFDPLTKQFTNKIYQSALPAGSTVDTTKADILTKLRALGIDMHQFTINWVLQ